MKKTEKAIRNARNQMNLGESKDDEFDLVKAIALAKAELKVDDLIAEQDGFAEEMSDSKADIVSINDVIQEVDGEDFTSILSSMNKIDEIIGDSEHEHNNTIADIFVDKIVDSGANMSSI